MSTENSEETPGEKDRDSTLDHYSDMGWEILPGVYSLPPPSQRELDDYERGMTERGDKGIDLLETQVQNVPNSRLGRRMNPVIRAAVDGILSDPAEK